MTEENHRRMRPRTAAVVVLVCGVVAALVAVFSLVSAGSDGTLLGGGTIAAVVAVGSLLLSRHGFRLARPASTSGSGWTPLLLTLFVAVGGVIGGMVMFTVSSAAASENGVAVAVIVLLLSLVVSITGLALGRMARPDGDAAAAG
jgi:uncharacterized membrane protein